MRLPDASIAAKYLINTHMMVKVVEFHPENQTVDVIQEVYDYVNTTDGDFVVQNEFGEDVVANAKELDILYGIPVRQARFGQFSVRCCPKAGDTGYLEIFTEDLQDWFKNGGPSLPWAALRFMRKNSVFVPFVPNNTNCVDDYPTTNESFLLKSAHTTVKINDPEEGDESLEISMRNGVSLKISADGSITANCQNTTITSSTAVTIDTPSTTITGDLNVNGAVTMDKTLAVTGATTLASTLDVVGAMTATTITASGAVAAATLAASAGISGGSISTTGAISGASIAATGAITGASVTATGEVTAGSIPLSTHVHPGVTPGGSSTGTPTA